MQQVTMDGTRVSPETVDFANPPGAGTGMEVGLETVHLTKTASKDVRSGTMTSSRFQLTRSQRSIELGDDCDIELTLGFVIHVAVRSRNNRFEDIRRTLMTQDLFFVGCDGSTNKEGIEITITIDNGTFVIDDATVGVFYGLPPGYTGDYPRTQYTVAPNQLDFQGNINSVYSELHVQSTDQVLMGTITAEPALPVAVNIGTYGGNGKFSLAPGNTSASFKIPIANYGVEKADRRTTRLAQVVSGSGGK
jgi:hypothetical protein